MTRIIDIDETLDASGGANDSTEASYQINTDHAAMHVRIGGATTDADVFVESRLAGDLGWTDWVDPRTALANGYEDIRALDIEEAPRLRVRVVNNDVDNGADVRVVIETA